MLATQELFDTFPDMQFEDNQGLVPARASDPGWEHGIMVNGGRQKIKCKYCHKIMLGGGISRLKQHLAGERGNVAPCEEVPEDVKVQIQQHLGFKVLEKLKKQKGIKGNKHIASDFHSRERGEDDDVLQSQNTVRGCSRRRGKEVVEGTPIRTKRPKKQNFLTAPPIIAQNQNQNFASQESIDQADMAVAKFIYEAGIPFSVANSQYFQRMADAIAAVGPGYKMPSYHSLRGKLLNRSVQDAREQGEELKKSWELTGCSIMVDRWMDRTGRTVLNFFAYCPKGTMFITSHIASDIIKSPEALLSLFDGVVQEVGPENIVNFVTDTSPSFKAAGKLLKEKYRTFFCGACAAHCIDLMLAEIGKMDEVKEVVGKAKRVTQFIYNNSWVLNLMRKRTGGRDVIQLATTRLISVFLTLQSIVYLKDHLHQMFTSKAWLQSTLSKKREGLEVAEIVVDSLFWALCDRILKVTKPLLSVLQVIDREEKPSVGYIYDAMEKAKRSVIMAFSEKESEYLPYLNIIDDIWQEELHSPLFAAAYYLNPSIFYNANFSSGKVIQKGFLDCIETLEPNITSQVNVTSNINFYEEAVGDFGRPVALRGRESLPPATWWSLYASDYPDLQRLAVRILSQTCCITRCGRSWSMFERIHSKKRNRLENQRVNDLILVHYNLHLQERRSEAKVRGSRGTIDPICLEAMDAQMGDWVEDVGVTESEDISWTVATIPSGGSFVDHRLHHIDDCNDSTNDRGSEDTRGTDINDDL